jgi:hypothetical protein
MVVDESRHQGAAAEIDPPRIGASQCVDLLVRPDSENPVAADGDRLRNRELLVDGYNLAIGQHDIREACRARALGGSGLLRMREQEDANEYSDRKEHRFPAYTCHNILQWAIPGRDRNSHGRTTLLRATRTRNSTAFDKSLVDERPAAGDLPPSREASADHRSLGGGG